MYKELTEEILKQVREIKKDLTMVELALTKYLTKEIDLESAEEIIWNNVFGLTEKILKLDTLLAKLGEE